MTTPITFELAKLLKEKGIKIDTEEALFYRDEVNNIEEHQIKNRNIIYRADFNYIVDENEYQTYTIAEVVMWLYEKHGIWISVHLENCRGYTGFDFNFIFINDVQKTISEQEILYKTLGESVYNSPTEAYLAAIEYTLNNLI